MTRRLSDRHSLRRAGLLPLIAAIALGACGPQLPEDQILSADYGSTMCPAGAVVEGIDVSHYDGNIDWARVKQAGKLFAVMKATEGTGYTDPTFQQNWAGAKANGVIPGAYHFFRSNIDPIQQADHFLQVAKAPGKGDLPLVADVETSDGETAAVISQHVGAFLAHLQQVTGRTPMMYTSPGFFGGTMGSPPGFDQYLLWVAHWGVKCPNVPGTWKSWTMWQYTDMGNVAGISGAVDLDRFNGSANDLMNFVGNGGCQPNCNGKTCGSDGCGGSCGTCAGNHTCMNGQCVANAVDAGAPGDAATGPAADAAAGPGHDGAANPASDGAASPRSDGAARPAGQPSHGCGCHVGARAPRSAIGFAVVLATVALIARRRRGSGGALFA
jgi:lysozyme